jgi:hypothetical protein
LVLLSSYDYFYLTRSDGGRVDIDEYDSAGVGVAARKAQLLTEMNPWDDLKLL